MAEKIRVNYQELNEMAQLVDKAAQHLQESTAKLAQKAAQVLQQSAGTVQKSKQIFGGGKEEAEVPVGCQHVFAWEIKPQ